jgi:hypothetical protein
MSILTQDPIGGSGKDIKLKLVQKGTPDIFELRQLHGYLTPGEEVSFISGDYNVAENVKLYSTHFVFLESESRPFLATIVPPKSGALNHHRLIDDEAMNLYPMNLSFSPQKAIEL